MQNNQIKKPKNVKINLKIKTTKNDQNIRNTGRNRSDITSSLHF